LPLFILIMVVNTLLSNHFFQNMELVISRLHHTRLNTMVILNGDIFTLSKQVLPFFLMPPFQLLFYTYAFTTAVYLINMMPTPTLNMSSPYESIFNTSPNFSKLKVFGCLCYPWLGPYTSNKLESKSQPCVFLGYSLSQSAYLCFDKSTNKLHVSRHV
jgi:hypothetical protein